VAFEEAHLRLTAEQAGRFGLLVPACQSIVSSTSVSNASTLELAAVLDIGTTDSAVSSHIPSSVTKCSDYENLNLLGMKYIVPKNAKVISLT